MGKSFELQGGKELAKKLKELPDKLSVKVVRQAGLKHAKSIQAAAKQNAPEDTGRLRHFVGRGSRYLRRDGKVRIMVGLIKMRKTQLAKQGLNSDAWYGILVEKGTKFQRAQEWLKRAFDETAPEFLEAYMGEMKALVTKYAQE